MSDNSLLKSDGRTSNTFGVNPRPNRVLKSGPQISELLDSNEIKYELYTSLKNKSNCIFIIQIGELEKFPKYENDNCSLSIMKIRKVGSNSYEHPFYVDSDTDTQILSLTDESSDDYERSLSAKSSGTKTNSTCSSSNIKGKTSQKDSWSNQDDD